MHYVRWNRPSRNLFSQPFWHVIFRNFVNFQLRAGENGAKTRLTLTVPAKNGHVRCTQPGPSDVHSPTVDTILNACPGCTAAKGILCTSRTFRRRLAISNRPSVDTGVLVIHVANRRFFFVQCRFCFPTFRVGRIRSFVNGPKSRSSFHVHLHCTACKRLS
jgi:hypothetical protein